MNVTKIIPTKATAIAAAATLATMLAVGTATAASTEKDITLRPGNGMSFVVGKKRATTYFHQVAGQCDVTVMVSEATWLVKAGYVPASRMRVKLTPGTETQIDSFDGKSISFACNADAKSMTVRNKQFTVSSLAQ